MSKLTKTKQHTSLTHMTVTIPHGALAKHGAAAMTYQVNLLDTDATLEALKRLRVHLAKAMVQLDQIAACHMGVAAMRDIVRKSINACDGLLKRVSQKQGGELYTTQLSAAQGALTFGAQSLAAAACMVAAICQLETAQGPLIADSSKKALPKG